ncbi:serine/threonine protein kinase, partial [Myxococcota bacterium]|nr:serine/threonine protein kinase [Myxococcota bacterium]
MAERFGRYWLHEKIGQGGMAEVFRATVGEDPEDYAFDLVLKRLHPHLEGDQDQVDMFLTEADISKFLKHPNIVQVYESGIIDGHAYIAMEYVWGFDLAGLLSIMRRRGSPFPPAMAAYIAMQILRALDYAHRATTKTNQPMELIHRDITPSNIYISMRGEVKVGDFGIARVSFLERGGAGVVHGKAAYLPPEILFGEPPEQQNDLWSVAAVFYEMLTLQRVYAGASDENLMTGDVPEGIIPVEELNPSVPGGLSRPLKKALHKREKRRPKDALTFYRQLK